jgi:hypothetical protein
MMVYTRHHVRLLHLAGQFEPRDLPVQVQWGIFIIFLLLFLLAIGLVWYMLKLFLVGSRTKK